MNPDLMIPLHYIRLDEYNNIVDGWSAAPHPEKDTSDAIALPGSHSYQFRLTPDGEENPQLYSSLGVPLYYWDGEAVQHRDQEMIDADEALILANLPSSQPNWRSEPLTKGELYDAITSAKNSV